MLTFIGFSQSKATTPTAERKTTSKGNMTGGFAILGYPTEYGNSVVMSFLINREEVVLEKDLGDQTPGLPKTVAECNPDETWNPVR